MASINVPDFDWKFLRRVLYVGLFTWLVGVRLLGMDPFDDLMSGAVSLSTFFDAIGIVAVWLVGWTVLWPIRPKLG